jgi:hypothetical protein
MSDASSLPANQQRKNSLGVDSISFLVVSAAAPLTDAARGIPPSMLFGTVRELPAALPL